MTKWILATVITLALPVASLGQDWRYFEGQYGIHKVFTTATGQTPDGPATTTLTLACRPEGGKGGILVFYGVREAHQIESLDLLYFEGPDAPAQHKRLFTLTIQTKQGEVTFKMKASGAFSDMDNMKDFQFEIGKAPAR